MIRKVVKGIKNPKYMVLNTLSLRLARVIPDKEFLKIKYKLKMDKNLNLDNPRTFNEKLQWLKLYNRNPAYISLVDKYEVRKYIAQTIGDEYLIPLIGVWDKFDDIDFDKLPNQFVLKPNHTSGNVYICKDKSKIDYAWLRKEVNKWMKRDYYWVHREWPYKNVKPKILCEKYLVDGSNTGLTDFKFMCFNGEPRIIQVMSERNNGNFLLNHFDLEWNEIHIPRKTVKRNPVVPKKPKNLDEMIEISKILSKDMPFVRIDLYETSLGIFFGEITFYPVSGFMDFKEEYHDYLLGSWIKLPSKERKLITKDDNL